MAERRMFTRRITESDAFLDMPSSSQMLYFHLSMNADDDGFVNNPKKIQRMCGASDDDIRILAGKKFIILFESGIIVIKHWRMHNYIQSDRYKPTDYTEEKSMLSTKDNKSYTLVSNTDTKCIQSVSVGKDSIGKDSIDSIPPTIESVTEYCNERRNGIDPQRFIDYYEARGWVLNNRRKMVDWKAAVRTWEKGSRKDNGRNGVSHGTDYNALVMAEFFGEQNG